MSRLFIGAIIAILLTGESYWETASPLTTGVLFLVGCFLVGVATLGRLWCSLYIAGYKTKTLVVTGPYSISRNPLYFFSMVGGIGVGLATETLVIPAMILIMFAIYYPFVIRFEENKLGEIHPEQFDAYCQTVPRFWPKWSLLTEPDEYTVTPKTFRKHIFSALWFIWMIGIIELIEMFRELDILTTHFLIY